MEGAHELLLNNVGAHALDMGDKVDEKEKLMDYGFGPKQDDSPLLATPIVAHCNSMDQSPVQVVEYVDSDSDK